MDCPYCKVFIYEHNAKPLDWQFTYTTATRKRPPRLVAMFQVTLYFCSACGKQSAKARRLTFDAQGIGRDAT